MPAIIQHIDAIARQKQRGVLFIVFSARCDQAHFEDSENEDSECDWKSRPSRQKIINWLEQHGIGWMPCGEFANVCIMRSYSGSIYLDLPYDTSLAEYIAFGEFLDFPDGTSRFDDINVQYLPLSIAMENEAHDAPGFWDDWAKNF